MNVLKSSFTLLTQSDEDSREAQPLFDISSESAGDLLGVQGEPPRTPIINHAEDEPERLRSHFLGANQFARVVEFSDAECILKPVTDELRRICEEDVRLQLPSDRDVWFCQLDTDVNLRYLGHIDPSIYMVGWLFAYQMEPGFQPQPFEVQTYHCSIGKPLDAAMFISRTRDPTQPFISTNLNAIIYPRVTVPLKVPRYDTHERRDSPGSFVVTRRSEGAVILVAPSRLTVDWDGPTAFLIKLTSSHFTRGSLMFLGVLLAECSSPTFEQRPSTEGRTTEVRW